MRLFKRKTPRERIELGIARLIERDLQKTGSVAVTDIQTALEFDSGLVSFDIRGFLLDKPLPKPYQR